MRKSFAELLNVRVEPETRAALVAAAKAEGTSISTVIRRSLYATLAPATLQPQTGNERRG